MTDKRINYSVIKEWKKMKIERKKNNLREKEKRKRVKLENKKTKNYN